MGKRFSRKTSSIAQSNALPEQFPFSIVYGKFIENSRRRTRNPLEKPTLSSTYINAKILYNIERAGKIISSVSRACHRAQWMLPAPCTLLPAPVCSLLPSQRIELIDRDRQAGRQAETHIYNMQAGRQARQLAMWQLNWNKIELKAFCGKATRKTTAAGKAKGGVRGGRGP